MGRNNKNYKKTLHEQMYDQLTGKLALGDSKMAGKMDGTYADKIYSVNTFLTYKKHCSYFIGWLKDTYPECTSLKHARRYISEWLDARKEQGLSAWTIQTESKALAKLYGIRPTDRDYYQCPVRNRKNIRRSRIDVKRDTHFSETNNVELIEFCRGTGCRRAILEKLVGDDLWSRDRMEIRINDLLKKAELTDNEKKHVHCLRDALETFPDQKWFLHHRKDKNGRYRFAPVIANDNKDEKRIVERFQHTGQYEKVWKKVSSAADVHSYRSDYAVRIYKTYARDIEKIAYDRINKGSGKFYQSDVYTCRNDMAGVKFDRRALRICSRALGHHREGVVADNYLRGI